MGAGRKSVGPVDASVAHNARVWNHWLGGRDNYAVDRQVGDHVAGLFPVIRDVARADREFLGRAVRYLAGEAGIRQFLDVGTGLPTAENTHEVAQRMAPAARIVYVDNDPLVLTHARALLTGSREGATAYVAADAHDPEAILLGAERTLDFGQPMAVMMLGILNFVLDTGEARRVVRRLMGAVPPGSYLVLTHPTVELGGEGNAAAMRFWNENATPPITARNRTEVASFLDDLDPLSPGLVSCTHWRPSPGGTAGTAGTAGLPEVPQFGALARKV
ncbi:SAM-dependent methyltransferase [Streptomyces sp. CMB-StM0423]|uniref:SAM-dependent methyltransferase n=1 Tax=Streptomyces sp. CMB-StM0423 TaxID=2059884 RepID=UPI001F4039F6|nr:SAM-dependent methyltransferase [Streptomyces sp. CMB-StM0423]